ncbi:hypothetical protein Q0F99_01075 [Rathayibacter oskolensis]|uniref:hypothetical protein n=1 Tax=Rathayibacter oskolensis TaxID=1891671 RepID=UPI00265EF1E8|nr:hypothetical protein [Rathayibacter oskolensis]WKK71810.1 hypothetical protein Q0F99_01075 [Rathayibacter oskolensis]
MPLQTATDSDPLVATWRPCASVAVTRPRAATPTPPSAERLFGSRREARAATIRGRISTAVAIGAAASEMPRFWRNPSQPSVNCEGKPARSENRSTRAEASGTPGSARIANQSPRPPCATMIGNSRASPGIGRPAKRPMRRPAVASTTIQTASSGSARIGAQATTTAARIEAVAEEDQER